MVQNFCKQPLYPTHPTPYPNNEWHFSNVNCLKLAVKPKLSEFQQIQKKYKKLKSKQLNGTKGGVSKNNSTIRQFTMKLTFKLFSTFLPWHGYPSKVLVIFTQEWDGGCSWGLSNWYGPTVHDVSNLSTWNTELCILVWTFMMYHILLVWFYMKLLVFNYPTGMDLQYMMYHIPLHETQNYVFPEQNLSL